VFRSKLTLEAEEGRPDHWLVRAPLVWDDPKHGRIVVPPGFDTDLASIPTMAQGIPGFQPTGLSRKPAVLHDWLYACADRPRMACDAAFYDALLAEGVPEPVARIYYKAVRVFGGESWRRHRAA
jgi:hypothetical protein